MWQIIEALHGKHFTPMHDDSLYNDTSQTLGYHACNYKGKC